MITSRKIKNNNALVNISSPTKNHHCKKVEISSSNKQKTYAGVQK
jgi:hypothetical protein